MEKSSKIRGIDLPEGGRNVIICKFNKKIEIPKIFRKVLAGNLKVPKVFLNSLGTFESHTLELTR